MTVQRVLLARRHLDVALLSSGFALLALFNPIAKAVFIAFIATGAYLAVVRHRVWRNVSPGFAIALVAYVVWTLALILFRGEPWSDNRALSYALVELGFVFLPLGICLVPRPLDAMVAGARLGVIAITILASVQFLFDGGRVGLGRNEAIFGFLAAMVGLMSRLPATAPISYLPNGKAYFYLSFLPVALSQTRAAWFVYGVALVLDTLKWLSSSRSSKLRSRWRHGFGLALVLIAAFPVASVVYDRLAVGIEEFQRFRLSGAASGSVDVRLVMWAGAIEVAADHPMIGVGGRRRVEAVAEETPLSPENANLIRTYKHLHNLFLDEALSSGIIGLVLLLGVFSAFAAAVWRLTGSHEIRSTAALVLVLIFSFGSFHGVLLNEWMIIQIFGFMSVLLTSLRLTRIALSAQSPKVHA